MPNIEGGSPHILRNLPLFAAACWWRTACEVFSILDEVNVPTEPANTGHRTTPLRALRQHAPYFHDGSAATLADVVAHYNRVRNVGLTTDQQRDLVEYLKSL
jgi:cytochrome c peroxidase